MRSTTDIGRKAEQAAKVYLEMRGYKIIEQNWRRPQAEVDIIARKGDVVYFVEVKYRASHDQGGGLEAITPTKLRHMQRAAEMWVEEEKYPGEHSLAAIELAGPTYTIMSFIDNAF
ncbi:MAG TPA: YraN family protein [Candidatus Saccharimonadales bacterium]|nr:YraN family protein [Candidatus Saccharimonadales bacterium]